MSCNTNPTQKSSTFLSKTYTEILDRRTFLRSALIAGVTVSVIRGTGSLARADDILLQAGPKLPPVAFGRVSAILTDKNNLNSTIAQRAYTALVATDSHFPEKLAALNHALESSNIKNSEDFMKSESYRDQALLDTAKAITKAWYLGHSGIPDSHDIHDNAHYIAFSQALMYQPTLDATIVPSYARAGLNYWVNPPLTIATD
ncbi:hypothetical protein ACI01nite_26240 [Acetobacter cibinongensis]|uniref:Uncharacterized protein n=1 Tax=Acetobacter cibinongensis TaxID=146475 RepID=A0A0D6N672_9PROT|nr:sugar dehydrogenase complex small subunit [Acetobacter cibinongensis]GAN61454.1 hypothetical protein Abci_024_023 [Acetobacter cibinongensis]GBQ14412.1 hypothetical protein AA0482_0904 [Acetobacter cibinongensis NRIC 0482]GEL60022.1 hypothetical protein ACI01nite_26240 [Acetobacter cibinongensis]